MNNSQSLSNARKNAKLGNVKQAKLWYYLSERYKCNSDRVLLGFTRSFKEMPLADYYIEPTRKEIDEFVSMYL